MKARPPNDERGVEVPGERVGGGEGRGGPEAAQKEGGPTLGGTTSTRGPGPGSTTAPVGPTPSGGSGGGAVAS